MSLLADNRGTLVKPNAYPTERDVSPEDPRIGVFVFYCGNNIGGVVDVERVMQYARTIPGVVYAERNLYTCSYDTQKRIREKIAELGLNRVVVASCTPRAVPVYDPGGRPQSLLLRARRHSCNARSSIFISGW
jgi:heterodisulfide reductase subunit A2